MKNLFLFILIFISVGACTKKSPTQTTVLKVGSYEVSVGEFSNRLISEAKTYDSIHLRDKKTLARLKEKVLQDLTIEGILLEWAKSENIEINDDQLRQLMQAQMLNYPDPQAFERVYSELKVQQDVWKKKLKVSAIKEKLLGTFQPKGDIDEKEIRRQYWAAPGKYKEKPKIKLQQIVVQTEMEAKKIHAALKKGLEFEKLAREYSLGPEGENGGVVGWVEKGTLPVFDAAFNMKKGSLGSPKKSPYGYHIFKVLEKKSSRQIPLDEVKRQFREEAREQAQKKLYQDWLEKQLHEARVARNAEAINSVQIELKGL